MWTLLVAVMVTAVGDEALSAPPVVEAVPAPSLRRVRPEVAPRQRGRLRASVAASGMGGVAFNQGVGGGGLTLELGSIREDHFSIAGLVSISTTVVTQSMFSAGPQFSWTFNDHFTLGGGPTFLAAWTVIPGATLGLVGTPLSLNVGATARAEIAFLTRAEADVRRSSPTLSFLFTAGLPLVGVGGPLNVGSVTLIGGAAIGWTWG